MKIKRANGTIQAINHLNVKQTSFQSCGCNESGILSTHERK